MNFLTVFIIGLIVGWVIEWVIDWLFWRRDDQQFQEKLAQVEAKISELEQEKQQSQEKLTEANAKISQLQTELDNLTSPESQVVYQETDHLSLINGIGKVFAKRLNQAGIYTFAQLANQTPERIKEIIDAEGWQRIEPERWIAEAQKFAKEAEKSSEANAS